MYNRIVKAVRIVKPPRGEAPEWVRSAWVGCVLPLAYPRKHSWVTYGVLSGYPKGFAKFIHRIMKPAVEGYAVESATAISILSQNKIEAADWWRKNTPQLLQHGKVFVFNTEACEEIYNI